MPYAPDKMPIMNAESKMRMCFARGGLYEASVGFGVELPLINGAVGTSLLGLATVMANDTLNGMIQPREQARIGRRPASLSLSSRGSALVAI